MEAAFPARFRHLVPEVQTRLGATRLPPVGLIQRNHGKWGDVVVEGEPLTIPYRQYDRPLDAEGLDPAARLLWMAWFTRNHDGHVRQMAVRGLLMEPEPWVVPYVAQLLGEYVIEIHDDIAAFVGDVVREAAWADGFRKFWVANPQFIRLTRARIASYWDEYYRAESPDFAKHPATRALATLDGLVDATR